MCMIDTFHLLIHSTNDCNSQSWANSKPKSGLFLGVFVGAEELGLYYTVFPDPIVGRWIVNKEART